MNTKEMEKIVERIQKCLNLADGKNATEEAMDADSRNKWALVVCKKEEHIENYLQERFPKLRKARTGRKDVDYGAYSAGLAQGRQINLRQTSTTLERKQIA